MIGVSSLLSHNSLFPKIKLYEDYFEYRILLKKKIAYSNIAFVEPKKYPIVPKDLIIHLKQGGKLWLTPGKEENLQELIEFFKRKGISTSARKQF